MPSLWLLTLCLAAALWFPLAWLHSFYSGWQALAKHFREESRSAGEVEFSAGTVIIGGTVNRLGISMAISTECLHLRSAWITSFAHPPLAIPWTSLYNPRLVHVMWIPYVRFDVGRPAITTIEVAGYLSSLFPPSARPEVFKPSSDQGR